MDVCTKCLKEGGGYCNGCPANPEFDVAFEKLTNSYNNSFNKQRSKKDEYIKIKDLQNLLQNIEMKLKDERLNDEEQVVKWIEKSKTIMDMRDKINNLEKFYF